MIIARVEGGLGNQMFIYAMGRALSLRSKKQLMLDIRNSNFGANEAYGRTFRLDKFEIKATVCESPAMDQYSRDSQKFYWRRKFAQALPLSWRSILDEPKKYDKRLLDFTTRRSLYVMGYWQCEQYFADCKEELRNDFIFKHPVSSTVAAMTETVENCNSVFIHIRRKHFSYRLTAAYYQNAMALLRTWHDNLTFFVFGDDAKWSAKHLPCDCNVRFLDRDKSSVEIDDLLVMSHCRHAIIANSSFSWWAAWLAQKDATSTSVICPSEWGSATTPAQRWYALPNTFEA